MTNSGCHTPGTLLSNLAVEDLTVEGRGVARQDGRVIFLDNALPGSVVSAHITRIKKHVIEAAVERVAAPSPHAVPPWCPHADECGACLWQRLSTDAALAWKHRHVRESLARIGKITAPVLPVQPSPVLREYRNKMVFAFGTDKNGSLQLGLRRRKEHAIVEVTECGMQPPKAMRILDCAREAIPRLELKESNYLRFFVIHMPLYAPQGRQQTLVECITGTRHSPHLAPHNADAVRRLGEELMRKFDLTGFVHSERKHPALVAMGERRVLQLGTDRYEEQFGDMALSVPYNTFLQTNTAVANILYRLIVAESGLNGTQTVWDVHSGIGSIALCLAPMARAVHGIEIQAEAVAAARNNSARLGYAQCCFHQGALTRKLAKSLPEPDLIVLDPPQAGLEADAVKTLLRIRAARMLYVSCDVATQARDIARLGSVWEATKSLPVDMFPYTPHVENLVVLENRIR